MFGLFYLSVYLYPNQLSESIMTFKIYAGVFLGCHILAVYLFMTTGDNPGFVDATETQESKKAKAAHMFKGHYDSFKGIDEENNGEMRGTEDKASIKTTYEELDSSMESEASVDKEGGTRASSVDSSHQPVKCIEYIAKIELPKKRFCEYCSIEQPYRSKHCKECERCVRKYDHHCFWIGGCVGELNHRKFWLFLFF
jgi:hypothetical protein